MVPESYLEMDSDDDRMDSPAHDELSSESEENEEVEWCFAARPEAKVWLRY